jgi:hypothetical protein
VDIIISFMHHLVNIGFLGEKFKVTLTGVKQCMLLEGNSCYDYFNDPFCRQASKGCRYPTSRLQTALTEKQNKHQLPLSYDMILSIKNTYWDVSNGCNDPNQRYRCGIFLCLEMGYDAGKRVGNLTHRTSSSEEDHCIRTSHVQFVFSTSSLYRGTPILSAGPEFREFMLKYRPPFTVISKAKLHFHTQKSTAIYVIKPTEALFVGRNTQMESDLDRLVLWSVWNWNDSSDEFFTRRIRDGVEKKLLRNDVSTAIKEMAIKNNLDPARFNSHSMRRGFVTATDYYRKLQPTNPKVNYDRGGWSKKSKGPDRNYTQAEVYGALSYPSSIFTLDHVWLLGGGSVEQVGTEEETNGT